MKKAATNSGRNLRSMYMSSFLIPSMPYSEYHANLHQYRQWAKRQGEFFRRIQHVDTGGGEKMKEKGAELSLIES